LVEAKVLAALGSYLRVGLVDSKSDILLGDGGGRLYRDRVGTDGSSLNLGGVSETVDLSLESLEVL